MQPLPHGQRRSLRVAGVLLALLALLVVVSLASRTGFGHRSNAAPTPAYVSWATSVFLVLFFAMTPVAIYLYVLQARERLERQQHRSYQMRVIRGLAFIFLLAVIWFIRIYLAHRVHLSRGFHHLFFGNRASGGHGKNGTAAHYNPTFEWPVLWAMLLLLLAVGAGWLWWRRKHPPAVAPAADPTMEQDVATSIGDAIDDLEAEPDPRRAVIAAYARMERVFGRHGLRRDPSETPTEYLRRILLGLTSQTEAVRSLTGLFEQAKFSAHTIDAHMKQDAIDALQVIRDDLVGSIA